MRKLLFSFFFTFSVSLSVVGQITLDFQVGFFDGSDMDMYRIIRTNNGDKLIGTNSNRDSIKVFNQNGSIDVIISCPSGYVYREFRLLNGTPTVEGFPFSVQIKSRLFSF